MTLEWILGRCDSLRAEVFLRAALPPDVDLAEARLTGTLTGPECSRAITLPVTAKLAAVQGGSEPAASRTVVARVILTEPSYWTPEMPNLYRLDAQVVAGGREVGSWHRMVGLRRFGVRVRSLWLDGRRYVPRGIVMPEVSVDPARCRAAAVAAMVADPSEALLERCDAEGVAVLAVASDAITGQPLDPEAVCDRVAHWNWHPAVMVAIVPRDLSPEAVRAIAAATRGTRGTVIVAREVDGSQPPPQPIDGIDALMLALRPSDVPHPAWRHASPNLPLLAWCRSAEGATVPVVAPSRRPCDALQASLAAWRTSAGSETVMQEWAGYVVGTF